MKRTLTITFALLTFLASAQQPGGSNWDASKMKIGTVSGTVLEDGSEKPLPFAAVSVFNAKDSTLATGAITDESGSFRITEVPVGQLYFKIDFMGYEEYVSELFVIRPGSILHAAGTIYLPLSSELLDEVEITETRSELITKIDRKIFDVQQDISSQGGDALTVLENVPSVEVDVDGNISLRGTENVRILLDGRPSAFSASELLRQMPASSIDKVEIITNPSAKYDPEGMAGILNIITKRDQTFGFNGNVNADYGYGKTPKYGLGLGLNLRNQKLNIFGNFGYNHRERQIEGTNERFAEFQDTSFQVLQDDRGTSARESYSVRAGVDYFMNDNSILYASARYRTGNRDESDRVNYRYFDYLGSQSSYARRNTDGSGDDDGYEVNAGLQHKFNRDDHTLDIDLNYSQRESTRDAQYMETDFDLDDIPLYNPLLQRTDRVDEDVVISLRADYAVKPSETSKLEAGLRYDRDQVDDDYLSETFDYEEDVYLNDENITNHFIYEQDVNAAYATFGQEIGKFNYQLGLRAEQTNMNSILETTDENFTNDYFSVFPSVNIAWIPGKGNTTTLSYSRRIDRPRTRQLNPFTDYSDPDNLRSGNPFLEPEFIDIIELGHNRIWDKVSINASVYYQHITDQVRRYLEFYADGSSLLTYENIGKGDRYGAELISTYRPFKWWVLNLTWNYNYYELKSTDIDARVNTISKGWSARLSSRKTLPAGFTLQIDGRYRPKRLVQQGEIGAFYYVNFGLRKSVFDRAGTISVNVRDVFDWLEFEFQTSDNQPVDQTRIRDWESRVFTLSVSYNFGQQQNGPKRKDRRNGDFENGNGDMGDDIQ